jgi:type I restriction enzyme M protein
MKDSSGTSAEAKSFGSFGEIASFIWSIAELLRGDYKQADYGKVILPFTVLRRLDCILADTRDAVWKKSAATRDRAYWRGM